MLEEAPPHLEPGILGLVKGLADCPDCVSTVRVPGYILVYGLHTNLQSEKKRNYFFHIL